nr:MAG TPA: hypothetical protein [Caudoviricetes sp.]
MQHLHLVVMTYEVSSFYGRQSTVLQKLFTLETLLVKKELPKTLRKRTIH